MKVTRDDPELRQAPAASSHLSNYTSEVIEIENSQNSQGVSISRNGFPPILSRSAIRQVDHVQIRNLLGLLVLK
jgi:hypothetical protein